jgi:hypothetical protein
VTEHAISAAGARLAPSPRTTVVAVALSMLAGVLVSLGLVTVLEHGHDAADHTGTFTAPAHAFTVAVPSGWRALPQAQLASVPSHPVAVLRRDDGRGTVVVRPSGPVHGSAGALTRRLGAQLARRFPGFQPVSARALRVRGGSAFVYTFVHGSPRSVQSLALVTAAGRAFAIDSVAPGDAPDAARQIGAIVASFGQ